MHARISRFAGERMGKFKITVTFEGPYMPSEQARRELRAAIKKLIKASRAFWLPKGAADV